MVIFQEASACKFCVNVGSMLGRCWVDFELILGRFGVDFRSWEGLGRVLGGS